METFLKALEKAPEMLALIALVYLFLKAQTESRREFISAFREVHAESAAAREVSRICITENTRSNHELTSAVGSLERAFKNQ